MCMFKDKNACLIEHSVKETHTTLLMSALFRGKEVRLGGRGREIFNEVGSGGLA